MGAVCPWCSDDTEPGERREQLPQAPQDLVGPDGKQKYLLSEAGVEEVIDRIKKQADARWATEAMGREVIETCVRRVNPVLAQSLDEAVGTEYIAYSMVIQTMLNDSAPPDEKSASTKDVIVQKLQKPMTQPLVDAINRQINVPLVSEDQEEKWIRSMTDSIFDTIITQTVGGMFASKDAIMGQPLITTASEAAPVPVAVAAAPPDEEAAAEEAPVAPAQEGLFSEKALQHVIDRFNTKIDIWFIGEKQERAIIENIMRKVNTELKEQLGKVVSEDWKNVIEIVLNDSVDRDSKTKTMTTAMKRSVGDPLAANLNKHYDLPGVEGDKETQLCEFITDSIVKCVVGRGIDGIHGCTGKLLSD